MRTDWCQDASRSLVAIGSADFVIDSVKIFNCFFFFFKFSYESYLLRWYYLGTISYCKSKTHGNTYFSLQTIFFERIDLTVVCNKTKKTPILLLQWKCHVSNHLIFFYNNILCSCFIVMKENKKFRVSQRFLKFLKYLHLFFTIQITTFYTFQNLNRIRSITFFLGIFK